ncbi:pectate lyase-like [Cynara cardunculus var. scolymus]|nr:pectate lyase-like [Cynara cardunculus var. scolymus]
MEMAKFKSVLVVCFIFATIIVADSNHTINSRRGLRKKHEGPCVAHNRIDKCWRCDPKWADNRQKIAECVEGFGHNTTGGKAGKIYIVTDPSDKDMVNPTPGTLRHAVLLPEPVWIIFNSHMHIKLMEELIFASDKTIDGRGQEVHITGGAGFMLQFIHNVIILDIHMYDIVPGKGGNIRSAADHVGIRGASDGDAISIFGSTDIWVDHCSFAGTFDGLIDIVARSTNITISNCHFVRHDKALLFGASDVQPDDNMFVTLAYNHFGKGLTQRLPAVRWGFVHVVNNDYTQWKSYAIGGAKGATIISQGNRFVAEDGAAKEITYRKQAPEEEWSKWTWRSEGDLMQNGAFFVNSGDPNWAASYKGYPLLPAEPAENVALLTKVAGAALGCKVGQPC